MKTIMRVSSLVLFIIYSSHLYSQDVSLEIAQKVAKSVYSQMAPDSLAVYPEDIQISEVFTKSHDSYPVYYIMNVGQDNGFVII